MAEVKKQSHFMLILVCLLCDIFVRPFSFNAQFNAQFNARTSIVGAIIGFCAFAIVAWVFFKISAPTDSTLIKYCLLALFFSTSAATIVKAEQFYRFISDNQMPIIVFVTIFIAAIVYASQMPQNALARSAVAIALLCILTVGLIVASNFKDINFQNLEISFNKSVIQSAFYHFNFSSEILLFYVLTSKSNEKQNSFTTILLTVLVIYCILVVLGEAVMGNAAILQTQPITTLSQIGSISVFKRLDSLYSAIWLLGMMIKAIAFYVYGLNLISKKPLAKQIAAIAFLVALIILGYSLTYAVFSQIINIACVLVSIIICTISLASRRKKYEKVN